MTPPADAGVLLLYLAAVHGALRAAAVDALLELRQEQPPVTDEEIAAARQADRSANAPDTSWGVPKVVMLEIGLRALSL